MYSRIVLFGHSYVSGLYQFLKNNGSKTNLNLGLENCDIQFIGKGGKSIKSLNQEDIGSILSHDPQLLFIMLGDNDLRGDTEEICSMLLQWVSSFQHKLEKIVFCQTMPRYTTQSHKYHFDEYAEKSNLFNRRLSEKIVQEPNLFMLSFEFVRSRNAERFFDTKGIHLNGTGFYYYQKEIKNAVIALKN